MLDLPLADATLAGIVAFYSIIHIPTEQLPRVFSRVPPVADVERLLADAGLPAHARLVRDPEPAEARERAYVLARKPDGPRSPTAAAPDA